MSYDQAGYFLREFFRSTDWRNDDYANLARASRNLLDFRIPAGVQLALAHRETGHFLSGLSMSLLGLDSISGEPGNSGETLPSAAMLSGELTYVFSTADLGTQSALRNAASFRRLVKGYWVGPVPRKSEYEHKDYFMYGRYHAPSKRMDAIYMHRLSPTVLAQVALSSFLSPPPLPIPSWQTIEDSQMAMLYGLQTPAAVSGAAPSTETNQSELELRLQHDTGTYHTEYTYTMSDGMFGVRGMYHFLKSSEKTNDKRGGGTEKGPTLEISRDAKPKVGTKYADNLVSGAHEGSPEKSVSTLDGEENTLLETAPATEDSALALETFPSTLDTETSELDLKKEDTPLADLSNTGLKGRWSAGGEAYFTPVRRGAGVSLAVRFETFPDVESQPPTTMTATINPIIGQISSSYTVAVNPNMSLGTRFDFNCYSYDADVSVGGELFRSLSSALTAPLATSPSPPPPPSPSLNPATSSAAPTSPELFDAFGRGEIKKTPSYTAPSTDEHMSVLKFRLSTDSQLALLWEGKISSFLVSIGATGNLKSKTPITNVGLQVKYWG